MLEHFRQLIAQFDSVADAARRLDCSRRILDYKIHGERDVRRIDILALERALQLKESEL